MELFNYHRSANVFLIIIFIFCKSDFATGDDVDECTLMTDNCDVNAVCSNTIGSFTCTCNSGYSGDGTMCIDNNECTSMTDNCDPHAMCTNRPGSFACKCSSGYSGTGTVCTDIEPPSIECPDDIHQTCTTINMTTVALKNNVDNSGEPSNVKLSPCIEEGDEFPRGTTHYMYTVTDGAGNEATCSFTVTVGKDASSNRNSSNNRTGVIIGCTFAVIILLIIIVLLIFGLRYNNRTCFELCYEDVDKVELQEKKVSHVNGAYTGY